MKKLELNSKCMQFKIKLQNTGSVVLHIYREWTIPDCPNKLFCANQGEEEMWAVLGRDGQLMSEQETLLYLEVMMMIPMYQWWGGKVCSNGYGGAYRCAWLPRESELMFVIRG
jgi:hypothetical protein